MPQIVTITLKKVKLTKQVAKRGCKSANFIGAVDGRAFPPKYYESLRGKRMGFDIWKLTHALNWTCEVDVTDGGKNRITVTFSVHNSEGPVVDYGTITKTLKWPFTKEEEKKRIDRANGFTLEWSVAVRGEGNIIPTAPTNVTIPRQHRANPGRATITAPPRLERLEICPVQPVPPYNRDEYPQRPPFPIGIQAEENDPAKEPPTITHTSPMNIIHNPAVIPILRPALPARAHGGGDRTIPVPESELLNADNAAVFEYTWYKPASLAFTANDPRLEWSITPPENADFFPRNAKYGTSVKVHGKRQGEVTLHVCYKPPGRPEVRDFAVVRAMVYPIRKVKCRINRLWANNPTGGAAIRPRANAASLFRILNTTNRLLRQIGVELVLDDNPTKTLATVRVKKPGNVVVPGMFELQVAAGLTRNVGGTPPDADLCPERQAAALNCRPNVLNINVIRSFDGGGTRGLCVFGPAHPGGVTFQDIGKPSTSWKRHSGVDYVPPPNRPLPPGPKRINLLSADDIFTRIETLTQTANPAYSVTPASAPNFAILLASTSNPGTDAGRLEYAQVLTHEIGHLFNLKHREKNPASATDGDGLDWPRENVMYWADDERSLNLDIIQAKCARASSMLTTAE
ncbi:MAG: hypothetical protein ABIG44_12160 [Planctomycetota bacterium]